MPGGESSDAKSLDPSGVHQHREGFDAPLHLPTLKPPFIEGGHLSIL
jgi:hypothetical protein